MSGIQRTGGALTCDGVPLSDIAAREGTPLYVYSASTIISRYRAIDEAFASHPHSLHYALKANSTLAVARLLRSLGAGADANSGGEIDVALRAGFIPDQIVFTGVGKTAGELAQAIDLGVRTINAESEGELERIDALARARQTRARVALRLNPDIDAKSHPHISTGLKTNKFGIGLDHVRGICQRMAGRAGLEIVGLHMHIGSQITDLDPLARAASAIVRLARELGDDGIAIDHVDLGGGLGISYDGSPVPSAADYAAALLPVVRGSGLHLVLEPGRNIVAPAGVLLSRVVDIKEQPGGKLFVILDAGMTELIRPMLYGAFHRIEPVEAASGPETVCDVVGPLCESSDTLGKDRPMPRPGVGDLMAVLDAGAYGAVMASNYNRRPMPAEVLVQDGTARVIRRRQTIDDLLALEA
ncbi:MAG: diaminopimelate decarboxylase [Acidobacteria bacterium]|nr:diaminopimelate decarboxylase [Acidobacteriota bacterium]MBA3887070.1 diaminopimelate decarboxylase [Acidobacteriota bacterium]